MRLNPEAPRCPTCDQRCRDQADLIAHRAIHSSEELASGLEKAATDGLRAQAGLGAGSSGSDA